MGGFHGRSEVEREASRKAGDNGDATEKGILHSVAGPPQPAAAEPNRVCFCIGDGISERLAVSTWTSVVPSAFLAQPPLGSQSEFQCLDDRGDGGQAWSGAPGCVLGSSGTHQVVLRGSLSHLGPGGQARWTQRHGHLPSQWGSRASEECVGGDSQSSRSEGPVPDGSTRPGLA